MSSEWGVAHLELVEQERGRSIPILQSPGPEVGLPAQGPWPRTQMQVGAGNHWRHYPSLSYPHHTEALMSDVLTEHMQTTKR